MNGDSVVRHDARVRCIQRWSLMRPHLSSDDDDDDENDDDYDYYSRAAYPPRYASLIRNKRKEIEKERGNNVGSFQI